MPIYIILNTPLLLHCEWEYYKANSRKEPTNDNARKHGIYTSENEPEPD